MALTIASALLIGLIVEADGLRVWADRLTVGLLRGVAQPATRRWADLTHPLHLNVLRQWALQGKEELSTAMLALPRSCGRRPFGGAAPRWVAGSAYRGSSPMEQTAHLIAGSESCGGRNFGGSLPDGSLALVPDFVTRPDETSAGPVIASATAPVAKPDAATTASSTATDNAKLAMRTRPVRVSASVTLQLPPLGLTREVQVALAGDSMMAVGLAPTLTRGLATEKNMHLLRAYRSGTGLARPEVLDWVVEYPRMLGANKPDMVICAIGANDAQNVQVGKEVLQFGSPQWNDFFRQRLTAYLDMLTRDHARVLWLAMPVMKAATFSQKMEQLNAVARATVAQYPGVTWLDLTAALGNASDGFHQFRADEHGRLIKMRADDGIHLTDDGAAYLLPPIRDWLARAATASAAADE